MKRTAMQRVILLATVLLAAAPLGLGLFRAWQTGTDYRMLWMAVASTIFVAGVLGAAVGRRRTRHATFVQAGVIFLVSTLVAGGMGFLLGATAGPGVWMVAAVLSVLLAAASVLVHFAHPGAD